MPDSTSANDDSSLGGAKFVVFLKAISCMFNDLGTLTIGVRGALTAA